MGKNKLGIPVGRRSQCESPEEGRGWTEKTMDSRPQVGPNAGRPCMHGDAVGPPELQSHPGQPSLQGARAKRGRHCPPFAKQSHHKMLLSLLRFVI